MTPLGSSGKRSLGQVVAAIVNYLGVESGTAGLDQHPQNQGGDGTLSTYYADGGDGPGRWMGVQAAASGLSGTVQARDFSEVLAGRDPRTGERLISARGSAGRRADLGAGNETRRDERGLPLYDAHDVAAVLGISVREAERMMEVGHLVAAPDLADGDAFDQVSGASDASRFRPGRLPVGGDDCPGAAAEQPGPRTRTIEDRAAEGRNVSGGAGYPAQPGGSYLVPVMDRDGAALVTEEELVRCEAARSEGPDPDLIAKGGGSEDDLSLTEAARLVGVTGRYLRRLAGRWESQRDSVETALAENRDPPQAWLPAHRGTRDRWFVRRSDLVEFAERRRPPAVRVGYDLTLTTEKSLSVLALLATPEVRERVLDAVREGNDAALGWFEQRAATTRVRGNSVLGAGWTVASFQHLTSRALDPFAHHHNVVANTVVGPDGQRRALDARDLYRHAQGASAVATVEMRHRLAAVGVRWRMGATGAWEVDGIPDEVLREFSQRRTEIDEALTELEEAIGRGARPDEVEHIVLKTRPTKQRTPVAQLTEQWWQRAADIGFLPTDLASTTEATRAHPVPTDSTVFEALCEPEGVCATTSVFGRNELLVALAHLAVPAGDGTPQPLAMAMKDLEAMADRFLASDQVRCLSEADGRDYGQFTTVRALATQQRIIDRYLAGLSGGHGEVDSEMVSAALDHHTKLSVEQRRLVRSFCQSGDRIQTAIGRAGAGKTTTMAAAADAWQSAGYQVLGAAVKGEAARTLANATEIACETVAWHLAHTDPDQSPLDSRTVLVVDEASTLADTDLGQLSWLAEQTGATLRLIGDPAQHGAVAAGGMFRVLCQHKAGHTPELATSHRLQHSSDRAAVEALREGHIGEALETLRAAGHLHIANDDLGIYTAMLTRWWDAHLAGDDHPMVDRRNSTRRQLNRLAHQLRQANGEVGVEEIRASGDRRFSVGDRITARTPARELHPEGDPTAYVRNGTTGTIAAICAGRDRSRDRITVDFDGLGCIELPRTFFDEHERPDGRRETGIDHAYALTSFAVQGSTYHTSTSSIDEGGSRPEAYVDTTRGRHANHLYLTRAADPLDGEHLPKAPALPLTAAITDRLNRSGPQPTAWELVASGEPSASAPSMERTVAR